MKDLITLIKQSGAIRRFTKKSISDEQIKLIMEGGVWGPSLFGIQPWHFVVIKKLRIIKKIASTVCSGSNKEIGGLEKLLKISSRILSDSKILIAIYITNKIKKGALKYGRQYARKAWIAEMLSAGAATQNMFLLLNSMDLGGVWLDVPTIFSNEINQILNEKDELVAFLAIGYPNQKATRSYRNYDKLLRFV